MQAGELQALAATFLRGTARAELPALPGGPLGEALVRVQRATPEETLLARAALSGLYAQAGRIPAKIQTPAPVFTEGEPETRRPVSAALLALVAPLSDQPEVLYQTLGLLNRANLTLPAPAALPLLALMDGGSDSLSGPLWALLDEHGRWLTRLNPEWKRHDPATPPDSLRLSRLRREIVEAHAADPEATAAKLLARWPALKADERRVSLGAAASSLHPADWPLLHLAMTDRLPDLRRRALLLQGHLPGEVQDAVRAALPTWFVREKGKLKLVAGQSVAALGQPEPQDRRDHGDSELSRLLGAVNTSELLLLLGVNMTEFLSAVGTYSEHVGSSPARMRGQQVLGDLERASVGGLTLADLEALRLAVTPDSLVFWPRARLEALLWEATGKLLRVPQENHALAFLVQSLLNALSSLPDSVQELERVPEQFKPGQPKKGLLSRLASAFRPAPETARDWPRRWEELARWIQDELGREVQHYVSPLPALLETVSLALDLLLPDPLGAEPHEPRELPDRPSKAQQEARTVALILLGQQTRARAGLVGTLDLRRRVRDALDELE